MGVNSCLDTAAPPPGGQVLHKHSSSTRSVSDLAGLQPATPFGGKRVFMEQMPPSDWSRGVSPDAAINLSVSLKHQAS